ncbi:hypothetical protein COHA_008557 [Chlorella ohadii]|uniref:BTB domain-containing protein n=1 Tax=Chlorella ohadii TaxID=2649997 RepID=A0AAD5H1H0_9CHLO|nr:hypothetical protein COHA_008557 [Chlorella ohadii]
MLVRTSSGNTSVVSSRFFTEFFTYIKGQKQPEVISLDAVKCEALGAVSLGYYLEFVYSGALPAFDATADAVELLRLGAFFSNAALVAQLCAWLASQLPSLDEEMVLEVFRTAVDLKQRRLVTECLVLLLPQFGRCTADSTVAAVIDLMDATLSKVVLTQLAMQGASAGGASPLRRTSSGGESAASDSSISLSPHSQDAGYRPPSALRSASRLSGGASFEAAAAAEQERLKQQFVSVLEARGWGQ